MPRVRASSLNTNTEEFRKFMTQQRSRVVFGPELPQFGSWNWLGRDLVTALSGRFETQAFRDEIGAVDALVILKFLPPLEVLQELRQRTRIVYCPVDLYGAASDIDADAARLQCCDRIVVHCERVTRYFRGYAPVFSLPHHVKYLSDIPAQRPADGPLLWIGVRGNLPPVIEWANRHGLPRELVVFTDVEPGLSTPSAAELGFQSGTVRVEPWTVESHLQWLPRCRAALDVKAGDFRSRHKPAAKVMDYLASGVPVAVLPDSSAAEALAELGFEAATPDDPRWLSDDYLAETVRFGRALRELYSLRRVAWRWERLLNDVLTAH